MSDKPETKPEADDSPNCLRRLVRRLRDPEQYVDAVDEAIDVIEKVEYLVESANVMLSDIETCPSYVPKPARKRLQYAADRIMPNDQAEARRQ